MKRVFDNWEWEDYVVVFGSLAVALAIWIIA